MPRIINERPTNNHIKNDIIVAHLPPVNCNYTLLKGSKTNSLNHNSSYNVKVKNERLQYSTLVIVYRCKPLYNISIQLLLLFIILGPAVSDALNTNFNTTLVIVYQDIFGTPAFDDKDFNTTLVIV